MIDGLLQSLGSLVCVHGATEAFKIRVSAESKYEDRPRDVGSPKEGKKKRGPLLLRRSSREAAPTVEQMCRRTISQAVIVYTDPPSGVRPSSIVAFRLKISKSLVCHACAVHRTEV